MSMSPRRYITVVVLLVVSRLRVLFNVSEIRLQLSLHYILSLLLEDYGRLVSLAHLGNQFSGFPGQNESSWNTSSILNNTSVANITEERRANATFVFLCRNNDLAGVVSSIQQMEDRFNKRYNYPWVLLNDEPFTEEFKKCACSPLRLERKKSCQTIRRVQVLTSSPISFGQIPQEHWYQPDWIDEDKARSGRLRMMAKGIIYAGRC